MLPVEQPFKTYTGLDGKPLDNGYIYFGLPNQDPITHPVTVYWDSAATLPAAQPLRTVNGYIMNAGTPANVFFDGAYSELVKDSKGRQVFYARTSDEFSIATAVATFLKNIALAAGSSLIGFAQAGAGAVPHTAQDKLRERVSLLDFLTKEQIADARSGAMTLDMTSASQKAIDYASSIGAVLAVPAGTYKLVPATATADESGATIAALIMRSDMNIQADPGAIFKIADNVSTDLAPKSMRMFFSNAFLTGIRLRGLRMDMNGQANPISPNRAAFNFNRWTQAHICFSGTPGGVAAGANDVVIEDCEFVNGPGVSCIVMAQSNAPGITLGKNWRLANNTFYNNGLDTDDHSSVFGWATDVLAFNNKFDNPAIHNAATHTGGLVAFEVHGSRTTLLCNKINNYYQGVWVSINLTEEAVRDVKLIGNTARVSETFCDFYSANLSAGPSVESAIEHVSISGNTIEITGDAVNDQVKAFFKIAARRQPSMVRIAENICRNYDATKNTVLVLLVVSPNQLAKANQITIEENTAAGISAGLVTYFSGNGGTAATDNVASITFANNDLGVLVPSPGGLYLNTDVILYGSGPGRIEALRVYGLQTPAAPISVDAPAGGRATVYGNAVVPVKISWDGVANLGDGTVRGRVAIDTDAGYATVGTQLTVGAGTTFTGGPVFPRFTGLTADASATVAGLINYPAGAAVLGGRVDNTGSWATMFSDSGVVNNESPSPLVSNTQITVGGDFPARFATI